MYVLSDLSLSLFVFYMIEINCSLCGGVQSFLVVHTFYQYLLFQFLSIVGAVSGLQCTVDFFFSSELFVVLCDFQFTMIHMEPRPGIASSEALD